MYSQEQIASIIDSIDELIKTAQETKVANGSFLNVKKPLLINKNLKNTGLKNLQKAKLRKRIYE